MNELPDSWADLFDRFAQVLGGAGGKPEGSFYEEASEWFQQAVEARYGVPSLRDITRQQRQLAFQRATSTLFALYEHGDLAFTIGVRAVIRDCFARTWEGVVLEGPAWSLDPTETERPSHVAWKSEDDFPSPTAPGVA